MITALKNTARRCRRLGRVIRGQDLWYGRQVTVPVCHYGSDYGGWTLCPTYLDAASVIYSFGVGEDASFECDLMEEFDCQVHAFDPTPKSIRWVHAQRFPGGFRFHELGLAAYDGEALFQAPADPSHVSYAMVGGGSEKRPDSAVAFPVQRLSTILRNLGHQGLDLLKMDIEGAEYDVLEDFVGAGIPARQILVEFHHRFDRKNVPRTRQAIRQLQGMGYQIFAVAPSGEEYSFIHRSVQNSPRRP